MNKAEQFYSFMGVNRLFPEDLIFYHYCTPETFLAICSGKKLRFSDLNCMNDHMENLWGYNIWIEVANDLLTENLVDESFIDKIDKIVHEASIAYLRLASCLSRDGDVLSQWRAYAGDGSGFSVGFSANELLKLPVKILKVIYDKNEQKDIVRRSILACHQVENKSDNPFTDAFEYFCNEFAISLSCFKNPAFSEELETRLIHVVILDLSDIHNPIYTFGDGVANGKPCKKYEIKYRMTQSVPTAFIDIDFFYDVNPIKKVILGPKNMANPIGVLLMMSTLGLKDVEVKTSEASYR